MYNLTIKSSKDLKVASSHNAQKVLKELAKSDPEFKQRYPKGVSRHAYQRFNEDLRFFNNSSNDTEKSMASKFYAALKAKGYDAVYDAHDQKGDYNTKSPVIIFNTGKLLSKK